VVFGELLVKTSCFARKTFLFTSFFNLAAIGHTSAGPSEAPLWDRHQVAQAFEACATQEWSESQER